MVVTFKENPPKLRNYLNTSFSLFFKMNQIFHHTRFITPKRVANWRGPSPSHCARATQFFFKENTVSVVSRIYNTVSDFTTLRFEPQTSCSKDECRSTNRPVVFQIDETFFVGLINWDFARARSTINFVREFWQMRIDLLITNKW